MNFIKAFDYDTYFINCLDSYYINFIQNRIYHLVNFEMNPNYLFWLADALEKALLVLYVD
jgi:hypothetical protein